jgi:Domain of unknown function (DUF4145)
VPIPTFPISCGHCGRDVGAEVVFVEGVAPASLQSASFQVPQGQTVWLRCPACGEGSVRTAVRPRVGTIVFPGPLPAEDVPNLPDDVKGAWIEARRAYSVGAYTASEIMCRKILMHLAVDKAGSAPGRSFVDYINDLQTQNYIMAGLQPVVDQVRNRGNKANHELPASTQQEALVTLTITQHLLIGVYELPALPGSTSPTTP